MPEEIGTYASGLTLKTKQKIIKNDIITLCNLLNNKDKYSNLCEFQPEGITEGGILFKFNKNNVDYKKEWYKSVRLCVGSALQKGPYNMTFQEAGKWYRIYEGSLAEWDGSDDIIFNENTTFSTFLKSFNGAPLFTLEELKLWEECFNQIGIVKVGKYPSKKSLMPPNI
tara:strand:- start:541 stop:1047 length:507 start_codon:yes stop_codon:yes gene_type:complete